MLFPLPSTLTNPDRLPALVYVLWQLPFYKWLFYLKLPSLKSIWWFQLFLLENIKLRFIVPAIYLQCIKARCMEDKVLKFIKWSTVSNDENDWHLFKFAFKATMSQVRQVGLLAAGCQPWNKDVCAASGDRFAYCATLAIYIYQV